MSNDTQELRHQRGVIGSLSQRFVESCRIAMGSYAPMVDLTENEKGRKLAGQLRAVAMAHFGVPEEDGRHPWGTPEAPPKQAKKRRVK